jgi:hypothetical protein
LRPFAAITGAENAMQKVVHFNSLPQLLRCRCIRIAAEGVRDIRDRLLGVHAVARLVKRRGNHGDAELTRANGNYAAADIGAEDAARGGPRDAVG